MQIRVYLSILCKTYPYSNSNVENLILFTACENNFTIFLTFIQKIAKCQHGRHIQFIFHCSCSPRGTKMRQTITCGGGGAGRTRAAAGAGAGAGVRRRALCAAQGTWRCAVSELHDHSHIGWEYGLL